MRTGATFRLHGDDGLLTAADVTSLLAVEPTKALEAGEARSRGSRRVRDFSTWSLSTDIEDDAELDIQVRKLLTMLEPRTADLWNLVERGYGANWFCYVGSHGRRSTRSFSTGI
ncbi:MAG TPA: DUF4279 domain-containing protein [Ilumatobacter sp.]|nr:DUF4279 domain-containing protein [Ilumatobacter sp.]